jgi:hypothetical protein
MGWRDREDSRVRDAEPGAEYPWIQWVNRGSDLDPRRDRGGFFISSENAALLGDPDIAEAEACRLNFSNNDFATGLFLPRITVALIVDRFAWRVRNPATDRYELSSEYQAGARGKRQALALLRTAEGGFVGPLMITLTGTVSIDLNEATKAHRQTVRRATAGEGATGWFWADLAAGNPERRGQSGASSLVTPIVYGTENFDPDAAYIGDAAADFLEEMWPDFETWAHAWENAGVGVAQEDEDDDNAPAAGSYTPPTNERPTPGTDTGSLKEARDEWSTLWNALKREGVTAPPFLNNGWNSTQINECRTIFEDGIAMLAAGVAPADVQKHLHTEANKIGTAAAAQPASVPEDEIPL